MPERLTPADAAEDGEGEFPAERRPRLTPQEALAVDAMARVSCGFGVMCANENRILDLLDERDALLDILERLHSVQDGCPLHKYNTVWVKAMDDAQAAFDRAGGGA